MSQLIDMEAAKEFMKETLAKVEKENLIDIANSLEEKSAIFQEGLAKDRLNDITQEDLDSILQRIFSIRRKLPMVYEHISFEKLRSAIFHLLYSAGKPDFRFQAFCDALGDIEDTLKHDITGELLHFTFPDKYWLWSRWMWEPGTKTGAIPLVTSEDFDLEGENLGIVYMKVGKGVAFVHSVAEMAGFQFINRSLFGTDVYLSCVYIIYSYTILQMKMTKEFNEVMPGMTEFSRRLLGVYGMREVA
jgi:hypothetical protein